jgi:predicted DNA-binding protein
MFIDLCIAMRYNALQYNLRGQAMQSQITVRVGEEFNEQIKSVAKRLRRKRSDIVRMAIEKFISEVDGLEETKPYNQVKELIGSLSSGITNLGEAHREYLVGKLKKHA